MVDDGRTDGRTTEHGYTISSPCEPDGSGELIKSRDLKTPKFLLVLHTCENVDVFNSLDEIYLVFT